MDREGTASEVARKGFVFKDPLLRVLMKRLAALADTPDGVMAADYGRIEELCWLVRCVLSDLTLDP